MFYLLMVVLLTLVFVLQKQIFNFVFSVLLNTLLIYILLILICDGFNIIISSIILSVAILAISIYLNVKNQMSADLSFKVSTLIIIFVLLIAILIEKTSSIQGFGLINIDIIEGMQAGTVKFDSLLIAIIIINAIGVVSESSIAISEGIFEKYQPDYILDDKVFLSGMKIGSMILKAQMTTLFLNLVSLLFPTTIILLRLNYSFLEILNDKIIVTQIMTILICMMAVVLTVPLTSYYCYRQIKKA
ncbi:membrane protein [Companilactobacillus sp. RD055328]|uniref:YibE/F family protein n=1 Tax=Companilactobacillus sp. RD055328 TaxID=2916634 RepID=UPI001FC887D7|nr:YibE/F family protein [Companilactobacillus sp. RD055328]GKQ42983.1 membrane protein [Companilactobacillus sp. RD055328]